MRLRREELVRTNDVCNLVCDCSVLFVCCDAIAVVISTGSDGFGCDRCNIVSGVFCG